MQKLIKFIRLNGFERRLFVEAFIWLGIARLTILIVPFRRLAPYLGRHMVESDETVSPRNDDLRTKAAWALQTAAHYTPWESKCLVQAVAGKTMLKLRGVPSTLYLGLAKKENRELNAHAWLRSGDIILTGARGMGHYTVVATFADSSTDKVNHTSA
jgi:hypothetical protein